MGQPDRGLLLFAIGASGRVPYRLLGMLCLVSFFG